MPRPARRAARMAVALVLVLSGCSRKGALEHEQPLLPPETFNWAGKPVSFSPPPEGWRREGDNGGGWRGMYFVLTGSVGERIGLADHYQFAERDRRDTLRALHDRLEGMDDREAVRAISIARWRTEEPLSDLESSIARSGNEALDRATRAVLDNDRRTAGYEIEDAIRQADRMELRLEDVVERVKFRAEGHTVEGTWTVTDERDTVIAGVPARMVDYTWLSPERLYHGREFYFVSGNHLFKADFHGLEKNLGLFGRVVSSIRWPEAGPAGATGGSR